MAGSVLLVAGQVIRPGYRWLLSQRMTVMLAEARAVVDPGAFTWMVIRKGDLVSDIAVGDCLLTGAA